MVATNGAPAKIVRQIKIGAVAAPVWEEAGVTGHATETHCLAREPTAWTETEAFRSTIQHESLGRLGRHRVST